MNLTPLERCGLRGQQDRGHRPAIRRWTYTAATDGGAMSFFLWDRKVSLFREIGK